MINIKNEGLKERIYNILNKSQEEELIEEDLKNIETIKIDGETIRNEKIQYDYEDFQALKDVKSIVLEDFAIDDEMIEKLNALEKLEILELSFCTLKNTYTLRSKIKTLRLSYCDFEGQELLEDNETVKRLRIIERDGKELDIKNLLKFKNISHLFIHNVSIKGETEFGLFEDLKELNLDGCKLTGKIDEKLKEKVKISTEKMYSYVTE